MLWIDHLRLFVIMLVVNMHACVTYSHVGGWYITSANEPTLAQKIPFILWQGSLQSFFMGLLFLFPAILRTDRSPGTVPAHSSANGCSGWDSPHSFTCF